jgi:single-strand DNA-binding protein
MINKLQIEGSFVRDHTYKVNDKGNQFLANSVATTEVVNKDKKITHYFNVVCYGNLAEEIANQFAKGDVIVFEGKLVNNNYEKDGKKIYRDQIVITNYKPAEKKKESYTDDGDLPF